LAGGGPPAPAGWGPAGSPWGDPSVLVAATRGPTPPRPFPSPPPHSGPSRRAPRPAQQWPPASWACRGLDPIVAGPPAHGGRHLVATRPLRALATPGGGDAPLRRKGAGGGGGVRKGGEGVKKLAVLPPPPFVPTFFHLGALANATAGGAEALPRHTSPADEGGICRRVAAAAATAGAAGGRAPQPGPGASRRLRRPPEGAATRDPPRRIPPAQCTSLLDPPRARFSLAFLVNAR